MKLAKRLIEEQDGYCAYCDEKITKGKIYNNRDHGVICRSCYAEIGVGERELRTFDDRLIDMMNEGLDIFAESVRANKEKYPTKVRNNDSLEDRENVYYTLRDEMRDLLKEYRIKTGVRPNGDRLEELGKLLDIQAQRVEHKRATELQHLSPEEIAELEREFTDMPRMAASVPDMQDTYLTAYERGLMTEKELTEVLAKFKECAYRFCYAVIDTRKVHGNTRHCCDQHREADKNANRRYEKTGTYLPDYAYRSKMMRTVEEDYRKHETAFNDDFIGMYSKDEGEAIAQRPGGKLDTRGERRKVRERMTRNSQIQEQLEKYDAFKEGENNEIFSVNVASGAKIWGKRPHKDRNISSVFLTPSFLGAEVIKECNSNKKEVMK